jgi:hypothetical protein
VVNEVISTTMHYTKSKSTWKSSAISGQLTYFDPFKLLVMFSNFLICSIEDTPGKLSRPAGSALILFLLRGEAKRGEADKPTSVAGAENEQNEPLQ